MSELFSNYWIYLTVGAILLLFTIPWLFVWRHRRNRRWIVENGRSAPAKILKLWDTGITVGTSSGDGNNSMRGVGLLLEVHPPGGQPYQVKTREQLHLFDVMRLDLIDMVEVRIHPRNPHKVVVQWGSDQQATGSPAQPDQRLYQLKQMLDNGLITPQEYEAKKEKILSDL